MVLGCAQGDTVACCGIGRLLPEYPSRYSWSKVATKRPPHLHPENCYTSRARIVSAHLQGKQAPADSRSLCSLERTFWERADEPAA